MVSRRNRILIAVLVASGCEFPKVTIPETAPVIVVQAVLNTGQEKQYVVVENTLTGAATPSDPYRWGRLPDEPALNPIAGARVTISMTNAGSDCSTLDVLLREVPVEELPFYGPETKLSGPTGIYETEDLCTLNPGARLALEIVTADNRTATAVTTVPGVREARIGVQRNSPAQVDTIILHRTRDSIWVNIDPIGARALQLEVLHASYRVYDVAFTTVTDTMSAVIPGATILPFQDDNPFQDDDGNHLFKSGVYYDFVAAVTDTNYFDFARSAGDDFTGRGFINHVHGGIGVFGAVHPIKRTVKVVADQTDPREGIYRITGALDEAPVDITLDIYLQPPTTVDARPGMPSSEIDRYRGFLEGVWAGAPITIGAEGAFGHDLTSDLADYTFTVSFPSTDSLRDSYYHESRVYLAGNPTSHSAPFDLMVWSDTLGTPIGQLLVQR